MEIKENVSLAPYTTFKIGGNARFLTHIKSLEDAYEALAFARARAIDFIVLGRGSNSLVLDHGINALVIINKMQHCLIEDNRVSVDSGYHFALLGKKTAQHNLSGLEFASGIPGSVGGAVYMNAGANSRETKDFLTSVRFISAEGDLIDYQPHEMKFAYRTSLFQAMKGLIVHCEFRLNWAEHAKMTERQILNHRLKTQPYKAKTAGCCFCNPPNASAGALIEECGLKGYVIGGARVSTTHANFIENIGGATAQNVLDLIRYIQSIVYKKKQVHLELEVKILG
ncbi:MAG: UDP-N-acetylmuramate dehydrogenase [Simkaniaceae bacterium]|nr:UDP-N-acetylmuramate dehydrogenase [Simkaniaceae bacterium]